MQARSPLLTAVLSDLSDLKALHVVPLDVHQISTVTDYMVIASGSSSRHVRAIADHLLERMKARHVDPLGVQADTENEWVLVDFGDVVVHIMQPHAREFYQLEKLWSPSHRPHLALA